MYYNNFKESVKDYFSKVNKTTVLVGIYYSTVSISTYMFMRNVTYDDITTDIKSSRYNQKLSRRYYNTKIFTDIVTSLTMPFVLPLLAPFITGFNIGLLLG